MELSLREARKLLRARCARASQPWLPFLQRVVLSAAYMNKFLYCRGKLARLSLKVDMIGLLLSSYRSAHIQHVAAAYPAPRLFRLAGSFKLVMITDPCMHRGLY